MLLIFRQFCRREYCSSFGFLNQFLRSRSRKYISYQQSNSKKISTLMAKFTPIHDAECAKRGTLSHVLSSPRRDQPIRALGTDGFHVLTAFKRRFEMRKLRLTTS